MADGTASLRTAQQALRDGLISEVDYEQARLLLSPCHTDSPAVPLAAWPPGIAPGCTHRVSWRSLADSHSSRILAARTKQLRRMLPFVATVPSCKQSCIP